MDWSEQLQMLEQVKRDVATISTQLAHGELQTVRDGIGIVIESLTEVDDDVADALEKATMPEEEG